MHDPPFVGSSDQLAGLMRPTYTGSHLLVDVLLTWDMILTSKIRFRAMLHSFGGRLNQPFQAFVVDVGRSPLGDLIARQIMSKLHNG